MEALPRLFSADLITADDYRTLSDGYIFMRAVEHYLQLMHYRQTSSLPTAADELTTFARRLGFNGADAGALSRPLRTAARRHSRGLSAPPGRSQRPRCGPGPAAGRLDGLAGRAAPPGPA
ncbi:MAG: hypothetical protein IPO15_13640 [Anaerolineae bacterium]|nr:hypothetical protein [Anaerolineae bacterium]